jgi:DNA (cytosine-5)-methyltransferase 1
VENQRPGRGQGSEVHITCGPHEVIELAAKLDYAPPAGVRAKEGELRWRRRDVRTGAYFATAHTGLALWLRDHFGSGAAGKKMPAWALSMPEDWRRSLLDGYTSADGHDNGRRMMVSTVSRSLAVGVRLLALSLGHKAGLHSPSSRTSGTIEGRVVRMRPLTHVGWTTNPDPKHERTREADGLRWSQVKSVFLSRSAVRVFNLSVEEDESYLADGIVVHNCTNHSIAKGARRRKPQAASLFDDGPAGSDEQDRSRATMWDVCRFAEMKALQGHAYKAIIVENVVDARRWGYGDNGGLFDAWLLAMQSLGYEHEIVYLNSMFCPPVPQSRDRMYVVFWLRSMRRPNLKVEPPCWCPNCEKVVSGRQTWKKPGKIWGRYASQYFYSCCECYRPAIPGGMPAASIIDPTLPAPVIGEREKPLAKNTRERIRRGLERLATEPFAIRLTHGTTPKPLTLPLVTATARQDLSMVLPVAGNTYESTPGNRAKDAARDPLQTVHGTLERALVLRTGHKSANGRLANAATTEQTHALTTQQDAAMVLANTENNVPRPASREAAQTLRTQGSLALTFSNRMNNVPRPAGEAPAHPVLTGGHLGVVEVQRNGGVKRAGDAPAHTVRANGRHHAVVLANYSPGWAKDADRHPTGSLTAVDGHALAFPYSTKGEPKRAGAEPADTITTRNKAALVVPYYTRGSAAIASREPNATVSTRDRLSLVVPSTLDPEAPETLDTAPITEADIDGCRFRMFSLQEISRAMAMELHANGEPYVVVGNKRERMAQYGNAVTPPVMALLFARVLEILDEPSAPRKAA